MLDEIYGNAPNTHDEERRKKPYREPLSRDGVPSPKVRHVIRRYWKRLTDDQIGKLIGCGEANVKRIRLAMGLRRRRGPPPRYQAEFLERFIKRCSGHNISDQKIAELVGGISRNMVLRCRRRSQSKNR